MPAHFRWVPIRPGAFNEGATGMAIPGFGNGTLAASLATGVFRGNEAQKFHEFSGGIEARQVSELGHGGYGHRELDAAQGLEGRPFNMCHYLAKLSSRLRSPPYLA